MATIRRFPFISQAQSDATTALVRTVQDRLTIGAPGAAFWVRPFESAVSEVPLGDLEFSGSCSVTTSDRQEVAIQYAVTARVADPLLAARRIDFAIDLKTGEWKAQPVRAMQSRLVDAVRQTALRSVAQVTLEAILAAPDLVWRDLEAGLSADPALADVGLVVVGVRVLAVRPDDDVERALQATVREQIQAEADRAIYKRRAEAVERERAIKENELNNRTELARREADLVELQGANERRRAEQEVERERLRADAERTELAERLAVLEGTELAVLLAAVGPELLKAFPTVDSLVLTPELLSGALARLTRDAA